MGLISGLLTLLFGNGRNLVADTAEVFRVNADAADKRNFSIQSAALAQLSAEFRNPRRGVFDRCVDGLNRLPRPAMALGTLALFATAMIDPIWFSERMQGIALVPEPMWWLLGVIVSFYFGARHQAKSQQFQQSLAETMARAPQVMRNIDALRDLDDPKSRDADTDTNASLELSAMEPDYNPALLAWRRTPEERG
jgi:hypothetical protein